jgi:3-dehydroquinate dehydratase
VSAVADGTIAGFGPHSYELALRAVARLLGRAGTD